MGSQSPSNRQRAPNRELALGREVGNRTPLKALPLPQRGDRSGDKKASHREHSPKQERGKRGRMWDSKQNKESQEGEGEGAGSRPAPPGLCTGCSLYLELPPHSSRTLPGPSKHDSGDISSRKPSLTGPSLAGVPPRKNPWVAGTTGSQPELQGSRVLWSDFATSFSQSRSSPSLPATRTDGHLPLPQRAGALGSYTNPVQRGACLPGNFTGST